MNPQSYGNPGKSLNSETYSSYFQEITERKGKGAVGEKKKKEKVISKEIFF